MKQVLFDDQALTNYAKERKIQPFKIKQIFYEMYKNQHIDFDDMTTLSKEMRAELAQDFVPISLDATAFKEDKQTTKIWFTTHDGHLIETVIIYHRQPSQHVKNNKPKINRITLCISSQVWCPVNCLFCVTGKLGFSRNLSWDEMISQILYANNYLKKKFGKKDDGTLHAVRNIVFMGMGEPLLNYDEVKHAIQVMLQQDRLSLSKRHITISTAWVIPGIKKMIKDVIDVKLAISLHAPNQKLRSEIMPIAKAYPLDDLMKVIDEYVKVTNNRIFYEYIMIKNVTDKPELAKQLCHLLRGRLSHVNLIPYNSNPAIKLEESDMKTIRDFQTILEKFGITTTVRDSMGRSVKSACGQLWFEKVKGKIIDDND
jgi:23S rRNA (adenine2503-C2)-methyltransferase